MCNPSQLHEPAGTRRIGVQYKPRNLDDTTAAWCRQAFGARRVKSEPGSASVLGRDRVPFLSLSAPFGGPH